MAKILTSILSFYIIVIATPYFSDITEVKLGEKLFFETKLSQDNSISCASCHKPSFAFADSTAVSKGVDGVLGKRNVPTIMNMSSRMIFFYDGRAQSLIDQVHFPIEDPIEMNSHMDTVVSKLSADPQYTNWFKIVYNEDITQHNIARAIAAYQLTLETANTDFDNYMNDEPNEMSASAIKGREIFLSDRAKCFDCHFTPEFTADEFKNIGLYDGKKYTDRGRFEITKDSTDLGKFKVPGLRNIGVTAPYMHDGSFATLSEVIDYYSDPYKYVQSPINMDTSMLVPIHFTEEEKKDLEAFLLSLTDVRFKAKS
jgi:cytochrome c peroxidase